MASGLRDRITSFFRSRLDAANSSRCTEPCFTAVPGAKPIRLVAYYEQFKDYYPFCEMQTKRWFVENVEPNWWIFDIGANIGYYSILFSRLAPAGRVFAFEPTSTVSMLQENLQASGVQNATVEKVALGNAVGERNDAIFRIWGGDPEPGSYTFETLDHYCDRNSIPRVDCIKIDTDSFDFEVLLGAEQVLRQFNPWVVVELNHALAKRNQSAMEAVEWLRSKGYREALVTDYDNFVMKRRPDLAPNVDSAFHLYFDRRSITRSTEVALGEPLLDGLETSPYFHADGEAGPEAPDGLAVVAKGPRWSYAVSFPRKVQLSEPATVALTADVLVSKGAIGVGALARDGKSYVGNEIYLKASSVTQNATIVLPARAQFDRVVFRNTDVGGQASAFTIKKVGLYRVRAARDDPGPAYMNPRATHISVADLRAQLENAGP